MTDLDAEDFEYYYEVIDDPEPAEHPEVPRKALSIQQPWADLILSSGKDVENRTWRTTHRGPIAIHAGQKVDLAAARRFGIDERRLTRGAIVGVAEIVDCVQESGSGWFTGPYGFVLRNARPITPISARGALGVFDWRRINETQKRESQ